MIQPLQLKGAGKKTDWIWLMCHLVAHRQQFCLPQERSQSTSTPSKQSLHDHRIQPRHVNVHFLVSKRCFLKFTKCIVQHCLASARTMWCGYMYAFKFVSTKVQYRSRKCMMFYICLLSTKYVLACFFSGFVRSALETESFSRILLLDNMPFRIVYCFHGSRIGCHKSWHVFPNKSHGIKHVFCKPDKGSIRENSSYTLQRCSLHLFKMNFLFAYFAKGNHIALLVLPGATLSHARQHDVSKSGVSGPWSNRKNK